jgi:hypothetical protein
MRTTLVIVAFAIAGCGQREEKAAIVAIPIVTAQDAPAPLEALPAPSLTVAPAPRAVTVFEYPQDLAGKAVVQAVNPEPPALKPTERFGDAPTARPSPAKILNPEPTVKVNYAPPTIAATKPGSLPLSSPRESVPFDLGRGADAPPVKPTLPVSAAPVVERARDVNLPPPLPTLGRQLNERASLEDATSDYSNAAIVSPAVNVPLASASFLKVTLPDPYEFGDQIKPQVAPASEPGMTPAVVNPQRVK